MFIKLCFFFLLFFNVFSLKIIQNIKLLGTKFKYGKIFPFKNKLRVQQNNIEGVHKTIGVSNKTIGVSNKTIGVSNKTFFWDNKIMESPK